MAPLGQPQRLTFRTYSDAAKTTPADPTTVTLYLKDPTGTVTPYAWPSGAVTRESLGVFHYDVPDTTAGFYQYRWAATGAVATSTRAGAFSIDDAFPAALVSLEDAKAALNMTSTGNDDELQTLVYSASAVLLNHPNYRIADIVTATSHTEWADAGSDTVMLKHYPVTAVTSVAEYAGTTTPQVIAAEPLDGGSFTGYGWDYEDGTGANGLLVRLSGGYPVRWCGRRVKVVYTAGSGSVPADVRAAALKFVKHLWRDQRGYDDEPANPFNPEAPAFTSTAHLIPWEVEESLAPYKRAPAVA